MKRLFTLLILAAAHLVCTAQANPKIEALCTYLKALGIDYSHSVTNVNLFGLNHFLSMYLEMYDEKKYPDSLSIQHYNDPKFTRLYAVGVDAEGNLTYRGKEIKQMYVGEELVTDGATFKDAVSKMYSTARAKALANREAFNQIQRTISELQEEAIESYCHEYHQNGVDTIIATMALRSPAKIDTKIPYPTFRDSPVPHIYIAPEYVDFEYQGSSHRAEKSPYEAIGIMRFEYNSRGNSRLPTKDFDIAALQKRLAPIFQDNRIKRRTLFCQHDSTFDLGEWNKSLEFSKHMTEMHYSSNSSGEDHFTIYKFTNERQAREALHQVMDCIRQQIADDPQQAYWMLCDERFFAKNEGRMFQAWPGSTPTRENRACKHKIPERMDIMTYMDHDGFYIITCVYNGSYVFPMEWKTLKSIVNGKMTYYKDSL